MASRQEEKERLRAQRLAAEASRAGSERRRLILGYVVAGVLTAAVVAGLVAVILSGGGGDNNVNGFDACSEGHFQLAAGTPPDGAKADCRVGTKPPAIQVGDLQQAAKEAGCELKLDLPDEGNHHIQPTEPTPAYKTSPPTSGNHITTPLQQPDGAYTTEAPEQYFVHSLEHGRVEFQYSPKLPTDQQLAIKGVFDEDPHAVLLFPNTQMPYAVAATAWTQLVGCPNYSPAVIDVLRDFRDTYRGAGPETQVPVDLG
ncbi:MAG: DUF3105 domain-containing protein [Solirubrobacterales bacterium]